MVDIDVKRIYQGLTTTVMGQRIYYMKNIDSTNNVAKKFAERGAEEGTVI